MGDASAKNDAVNENNVVKQDDFVQEDVDPVKKDDPVKEDDAVKDDDFVKEDDPAKEDDPVKDDAGALSMIYNNGHYLTGTRKIDRARFTRKIDLQERLKRDKALYKLDEKDLERHLERKAFRDFPRRITLNNGRWVFSVLLFC